MFNSNEIKKAWSIRKEAAQKWNCKVSEIRWAECLRLAMEKKDVKEEMSKKYRSNDFVRGNIDRTYFDLNVSRKVKVYYDNVAEELIVENSGRSAQLDHSQVQEVIGLGAKIINK